MTEYIGNNKKDTSLLTDVFKRVDFNKFTDSLYVTLKIP